MKLLVDGESGDLYAIKTNFDSLFRDAEKTNTNVVNQGRLLEIFDFDVTDEYFWYLYMNLGEEYGGLQLAEKMKQIEENGVEYHAVYFEPESALQIEVNAEGIIREQSYLSENKRLNLEEIADYMNQLQWQIWDDEMIFTFPYGDRGEYSLDFRIRLEGEIRSFSKWGTRFADVIVGFPEIYERIPGFTDN